MKLSPPKAIVWWISFACFLVVLLMAIKVIVVPALAAYILWVALFGLGLLLLANLISGL